MRDRSCGAVLPCSPWLARQLKDPAHMAVLVLCLGHGKHPLGPGHTLSTRTRPVAQLPSRPPPTMAVQCAEAGYDDAAGGRRQSLRSNCCSLTTTMRGPIDLPSRVRANIEQAADCRHRWTPHASRPLPPSSHNHHPYPVFPPAAALARRFSSLPFLLSHSATPPQPWPPSRSAWASAA
jgi:hypothetical protein